MTEHVIAIMLAFVIDQIIGDPKNAPHPVRLFGWSIAFCERRFNKGRFKKEKGMAMIMLVGLFFMLAAFSIVSFFSRLHPAAGIFAEAVIISFMIAEKSLREAALAVYEPLCQKNLVSAREKLSWIVGRDTADLPESEIVRGTVETVAENTSDGITAPLFWALFGGAPFAVLYRVVNTADSMVGYQNEKFAEFGFASAKLDDLLNYLPSRLTAFIMVLVNHPAKGIQKRECFSILKRDARKHPSPNSGFLESAMAALLGVSLGGINRYQGKISNRPKLGDGVYSLEAKHIHDAIDIMKKTDRFFLLFFMIGGVCFDAAITWSQSILSL